MNWFPYVMVVHVLGVILWVGGLLSAGRLLLLRLDEGDPGGRLAAGEVRLFKSLAGHGMMLTILAGIVLVLLRGSYYMHQPWFHAKLGLVVVLVGLHVGLRVKGKKLSEGVPASRSSILTLHSGVAAAAALIVLLVFTQPF